MKLYKFLLISVSFYLISVVIVQAAIVPPPTGTGGQYTWCDLMQLFKNIIDFMIKIIFPLAAAMIVVGGGFIMTAAGSTQRISQGREIITAAIIGLIIALLSYLIIDTIIKVIAGGTGQIPTLKGFGPWNELICS